MVSEIGYQLFPTYRRGSETRDDIDRRIQLVQSHMEGHTPYKGMIKNVGEPRMAQGPYVDRIALQLPRARFLDIGCALGENVQYALFRGAHVAKGVTTDPRELAWGQELYGPNSCELMDGTALTYDDHFFDIVHARSVIHTLGSREKAERMVQEASRVLAHGGVFIGQTHTTGTRPGKRLYIASEHEFQGILSDADFTCFETQIPHPTSEDPLLYFHAVR